MKQQDKELEKTEKKTTRKNETLYIVQTETKQGVRETAYEIIERLVMKKFTNPTEDLGEGSNVRTCCLGD